MHKGTNKWVKYKIKRIFFPIYLVKLIKIYTFASKL